MSLGFYMLGIILMCMDIPLIMKGNYIPGGILMGLVVFFFILGAILEIAYLENKTAKKSSDEFAKLLEHFYTLGKGELENEIHNNTH